LNGVPKVNYQGEPTHLVKDISGEMSLIAGLAQDWGVMYEKVVGWRPSGGDRSSNDVAEEGWGI